MTTEEKTAPKKRTVPPGERSLHVTVTQDIFDELEKSADGRPINVWLSKLIGRNFAKFDK